MIKQYKVGDQVSYAIGGDRYSAGQIVRITKRFITTDRGSKFTLKTARNGDQYYTMTGCRYAYMIAGQIDYYDPHF